VTQLLHHWPIDSLQSAEERHPPQDVKKQLLTQLVFQETWQNLESLHIVTLSVQPL